MTRTRSGTARERRRAVGMSDGKLAALRMLSKSVCHTAQSTYGDSTISGSIAKWLVEAGLAKYRSGWQLGQKNSLTTVQITELGKSTLATWELVDAGQPPKGTTAP